MEIFIEYSLQPVRDTGSRSDTNVREMVLLHLNICQFIKEIDTFLSDMDKADQSRCLNRSIKQEATGARSGGVMRMGFGG